MHAISDATTHAASPARAVRVSSRGPNRPLWILGAVFAIALIITVGKVLAAGTTSGTSALTPALRLAVGTVDLEGTELAVDPASAARLLPLWELLDQLNRSSSAAPEELSATIEEIRLNMTAEQVSAIDSMSISAAELGVSSGGGPAASGTQVSSSAAVDPMLGGEMGAMGAAPMDGGGPMPSGSSQQTSSNSRSSFSSPSPAAIQRVIELLKSKVQS